MPNPEAAPARIESLDVLRGVAVMGILVMNAPGFSMPQAAYFNPDAYGGTMGADLVAWFVNFVLVDGKMRGLFSLLFGASMLLVVDQARSRGENAAAIHYSRIFWLAVIGAAHFYFLWYGDILLHYALIGIVAFAFCRVGNRALGFWIAFLLLIDVLMMAAAAAGFLTMSRAAADPAATDAAIAAWNEMRVGFAPLDSEALREDLALHRGSHAELLAHRWETQLLFPLSFLKFGGVETLALMLLGMLGLRNGFLTGAWDARRYRRVAFGGLVAGGICFAALALLMIAMDFDPATVFAATVGATVIPRLLMILGYAALIILLSRQGGRLAARISATGRAAFTNYLGTSILMTGLFYGWGLALYGTFSRAELWLPVLAAWAVMLLWSKAWLDRFRYGPLEWLWRSLARRRAQPMRLART